MPKIVSKVPDRCDEPVVVFRLLFIDIATVTMGVPVQVRVTRYSSCR